MTHRSEHATRNFFPRSEAVAARLMTVFESIDRGRHESTELTRLFDALRAVDHAVLRMEIDDIRPENIAAAFMDDEPPSWPYCLPVCPKCRLHICDCVRTAQNVTNSMLKALKHPKPIEGE